MSSLKKSIINKQEQQHIETTVAYIARWGLPAVFRKSVWKNRSGQKTGNLVNTKAARKKTPNQGRSWNKVSNTRGHLGAQFQVKVVVKPWNHSCTGYIMLYPNLWALHSAMVIQPPLRAQK